MPRLNHSLSVKFDMGLTTGLVYHLRFIKEVWCVLCMRCDWSCDVAPVGNSLSLKFGVCVLSAL